MGGVVAVVRSVVKCVFLAEGIGAVLYAFCFVPEFGIKKGLVHAIFLAVSAFCNAGIDLFGETSLSVYVSNHYDWPDHCVRSWIYRLVGSVG